MRYRVNIIITVVLTRKTLASLRFFLPYDRAPIVQYKTDRAVFRSERLYYFDEKPKKNTHETRTYRINNTGTYSGRARLGPTTNNNRRSMTAAVETTRVSECPTAEPHTPLVAAIKLIDLVIKRVREKWTRAL